MCPVAQRQPWINPICWRRPIWRLGASFVFKVRNQVYYSIDQQVISCNSHWLCHIDTNYQCRMSIKFALCCCNFMIVSTEPVFSKVNHGTFEKNRHTDASRFLYFKKSEILSSSGPGWSQVSVIIIRDRSAIAKASARYWYFFWFTLLAFVMAHPKFIVGFFLLFRLLSAGSSFSLPCPFSFSLMLHSRESGYVVLYVWWQRQGY